MNKKEIMQQFAKQILEQNPSEQTADWEKLLSLIEEIQTWHQASQIKYKEEHQRNLNKINLEYQSLFQHSLDIRFQLESLERR